jgi:hypothetical protein
MAVHVRITVAWKFIIQQPKHSRNSFRSDFVTPSAFSNCGANWRQVFGGIHIIYKLQSKFHQTLLNSDQSISYKILLWNDYLLNDAVLHAGVIYEYSKGNLLKIQG